MTTINDDDNKNWTDSTNYDTFIPKLPSYLAQAFYDLHQEDGLLVLGRGLGVVQLLAIFCRYYSDIEEGHYAILQQELIEEYTSNLTGTHRTRETSDRLNSESFTSLVKKYFQSKPPLIFILGLKDHERTILLDLLSSWGTPPELLPSIITSNSTSLSLNTNSERGKLYSRGGIFIITSRILIVDLLTQVVQSQDIDGIFVMHAENVSCMDGTSSDDYFSNSVSTSGTGGNMEAFILRIYRTQKQQQFLSSSSTSPWVRDLVTKSSNTIIQSLQYGFIKAFSDQPEKLLMGFNKVEKILKSLFVRRLYLYPRFTECVVQDLEGCSHSDTSLLRKKDNVVDATAKKLQSNVVVEELHVKLSNKMNDIQNAIAAAVLSCISELKKSTTLIDWTSIDLTLENTITTSYFDVTISKQLEHDWHRLQPKTKQLVYDLRTLRTLFRYLLEYDCISFWKLIQSIHSISKQGKSPSLWLGSAAAEQLFSCAKERLYYLHSEVIDHDTVRANVDDEKTLKKSKNRVEVDEVIGKDVSVHEHEKNAVPTIRLIPVLEENPKLKVLHQILTEIEIQSKSSDRDRLNGGASVLVMVNNDRTLDAVRSYLVDGKERAMTKRWIRHLKQINVRSRALAKCIGGSSDLPVETRLLLEEEGRARNFLHNSVRSETLDDDLTNTVSDSTKLNTKSKRNVLKLSDRTSSTALDRKRKKRRINIESNRGIKNLQSTEDQNIKAILDEALEESDYYDAEIIGKVSTFAEEYDSSSDLDDEKKYSLKEIDEFRVIVQTYLNNEGDQAYLLLNDIKPDFVILFDADTSFIRSLEIHAACSRCSNKVPLKIYFMMFESSSEEKNYMKAVEREQNAFERLIQYKSTMALPLNSLGPSTTQEMALAQQGYVGGSYIGGSLPLSVDSRTGKGKAKNDNLDRRNIAVDVREFRSVLPSILHQGGMRLAPCTLTVGDYVLSNVHCLERKSISDLYQSLNDGRLHDQAVSMSKYYKVPCLLIEFDPGKTFSLQNVNELSPDIRADNICSKIATLTMHFPRLRLLWSRSPHETLKLFKALKSNHEEVDVEKAIEIGSNESLDALLNLDNIDDENEINEVARDMLLRLPGVTMHNARKIMNSCDSIAELAEMPREALKTILGPVTGQKLYTFFNEKYERNK